MVNVISKGTWPTLASAEEVIGGSVERREGASFAVHQLLMSKIKNKLKNESSANGKAACAKALLNANNKRTREIEQVVVKDAVQEAKEKLIASHLMEVSRLAGELDLAIAAHNAVCAINPKNKVVTQHMLQTGKVYDDLNGAYIIALDLLEKARAEAPILEV